LGVLSQATPCAYFCYYKCVTIFLMKQINCNEKDYLIQLFCFFIR